MTRITMMLLSPANRGKCGSRGKSDTSWSHCPIYGIFDDLAFFVTGDVVTLMGHVLRPTLTSDAENVAKRLEGVAQVVNQIEVLPPSPMDDWIRAAEYRAHLR
jgi:hypothetical protein